MKELTLAYIKSNEYFQTTKATNAATNPGIKLPNCTTFCMCAWHWVFNATKKYTLFKGRGAGSFGNAKEWYGNYLFDKGTAPKVAAIACWDGSYGHVAFVKSYTDAGNGFYNITVYQSNYGGVYFEQKTYKVKVGMNTGSGLGKFQGFLYHPYYTEMNPTPPIKPDPVVIPTYTVGKEYSLTTVLKVRFGPGTSYRQKTYSQLTSNAKLHAYGSGVNMGCLMAGTHVTCLEVKKVNNETWIRIPSGWICGIMNGSVYVK